MRLKFWRKLVIAPFLKKLSIGEMMKLTPYKDLLAYAVQQLHHFNLMIWYNDRRQSLIMRSLYEIDIPAEIRLN